MKEINIKIWSDLKLLSSDNNNLKKMIKMIKLSKVIDFP